MSLYNSTAEKLDRRFGWDKLPLPLAMLVLIGLRNILRAKNLYDTGRGPLDKPDISDHPRYLTARTLDGTFNNLDDPLMGSLGSRFGRNVPLAATAPEKDPLEPNPRTVSRELLTRTEFIPASANCSGATPRADWPANRGRHAGGSLPGLRWYASCALKKSPAKQTSSSAMKRASATEPCASSAFTPSVTSR